MDPNSIGAQSLFDTNPQARPTLEGANPFGAQSWLELNVGGSLGQICKGAQSLKKPNPFGTQSLLDLNLEESPIFEGVKILLELSRVAIQYSWKPYPFGSPILEGAQSLRDPNP